MAWSVGADGFQRPLVPRARLQQQRRPGVRLQTTNALSHRAKDYCSHATEGPTQVSHVEEVWLMSSPTTPCPGSPAPVPAVALAPGSLPAHVQVIQMATA